VNDLVVELGERARMLRRDIIEMIYRAGSGHPGGSLSAAEIVACLYFHEMRIDPQRPDWADRDRFVLSKGHACPAVYAALAERGYFPVETLWTLRTLGSPLQGHPDMTKTIGLDMTGGSLGNGLSIGVGMALGGRVQGRDFRVFVLLGDGELQEGSVWEGAMSAAHYQLANVTAIVDYNGLQVDGQVSRIMEVAPLRAKWEGFDWDVTEVDGHSIPQILGALNRARLVTDRPTVIIAHTVKGKGVSFMENRAEWHGRAPKEDERDRALAEIEAAEAAA
jgi:transketolase